jgi:hypothetical protein
MPMSQPESLNLCKFCKDFKYGELTSDYFGGYQHHASWADLTASAESGCEICALVLANTHAGFLTEDHENYPVKCEFDTNHLTMLWICATREARLIPCTKYGRCCLS